MYPAYRMPLLAIVPAAGSISALLWITELSESPKAASVFVRISILFKMSASQL
jgi:hypothetical protein